MPEPLTIQERARIQRTIRSWKTETADRWSTDALVPRYEATCAALEAERETMRAGYETILAALEAENARLRAALVPLADLADCFPPDWDDSADLIADSVTLGDVRRARALRDTHRSAGSPRQTGGSDQEE